MNTKYRKTIIAGNWKMNMLPSEVKGFAEALKQLAGKAKWCEVVICPPSLMLPAAVRAFHDTKIAVGAQNVSDKEKGAYTGEISAAQLKDLGVKYVIVGHSERRQFYGETDTLVNAKARICLEHGLIPIICVGETLEEREAGLTMELVRLQVKSALSGIAPEKLRKLVIAYEPVWAIGTGMTATPTQAAVVCAEIRALIRSIYGARSARIVTIQYGGSMNAENADELLSQPDIDGGLIGGASLDPDKFFDIIKAADK